MTTSIQTFSPAILNDFSQLQQFMRGDPALSEIDRFSKDPVFIQSPSNTPYFNRWHVAWILLKTPFEIFFLANVLILANICQCIGLQKIVKVCHVVSRHLARDIYYLSKEHLPLQHLLMPARNAHQISSWDFYLQDALSTASIQDEKVKKMTFFNDKDILFFKGGLCRGGSMWFIYLFLKTAHLFKDKQKQLLAIAEQFKTGIPKQGALLQSFSWGGKKILNLKEKYLFHHQVRFHKLAQDPDKALQKMHSLPTGIYMARTPKHAFVYFKENETQGYIWDSNGGLCPKTTQEFLDYVIFYCHSEDPRSKFCFHQFVLNKNSNIIMKLFKKIPFIKSYYFKQKVKFYLD